jgi:hypothetical protein
LYGDQDIWLRLRWPLEDEADMMAVGDAKKYLNLK